ncbi:hypothetical protein K4F52_001585 [Lecanicillium sp. MT-2017a]|nr:hypothetical protein K4F52_001585 [Lecanicillium sp. MT-2017a]
MAPLPPGLKKPSARTFRQQRISGQVHHLAPAKTFRSDAAVSDDFLSSKKDKRLMKHSAFMSRVADSGVSKKGKNKRTGRGRSKKLSTTMESLADALPDLEDGEGGLEELQGKIRHKSLRSKKGALKRKEQVVKGEMERFGVSMAQLAGTKQAKTPAQAASAKAADGSNTTTNAAGVSNRWAALRGYISSTMEQNPAFANK